ncbi:hypothetical protein AAG747_27975 [Rapidithrix thailandica]|uniref:NADH dehydrogenase subunit 6 n=2 Tax=Rapidithrix thailandica TaxID=413964 RepID=A0AAW9SLT3_9BACT
MWLFFALPIIVILGITYQIFQKQPSTVSGKVAIGIFLTVTLLASIGMIGLYEGGYNHLLKNILYYGGMSQNALKQFFPPPTYEMPNDFWFEFSGILQFFTGIYAIFSLKTFRRLRRRQKELETSFR